MKKKKETGCLHVANDLERKDISVALYIPQYAPYTFPQILIFSLGYVLIPEKPTYQTIANDLKRVFNQVY